MQNQKGEISVGLVIGLIVVLGAASFFLLNNRTVQKQDEVMKKEEAAVMMKKGDESMKKEESGTMMDKKTDGVVMMNYTGSVLAGTKAKLIDFNKTDYDQALSSGQLVVLYFYANWCPLCKAEFPKMQATFNELDTDGVIGFRVNYNDNETDEYEKDLARQFGVAYQHTKVFLKNGTRILKAPDSWEKSRYLTEIQTALK